MRWAAVLLVLAACGGGSKSAAVTTTTTEGATVQQVASVVAEYRPEILAALDQVKPCAVNIAAPPECPDRVASVNNVTAAFVNHLDGLHPPSEIADLVQRTIAAARSFGTYDALGIDLYAAQPMRDVLNAWSPYL